MGHLFYRLSLRQTVEIVSTARGGFAKLSVSTLAERIAESIATARRVSQTSEDTSLERISPY